MRGIRKVLHVLGLRGRASRREFAVIFGLEMLWSLVLLALPKAWLLGPFRPVFETCNLLSLYLYLAVSVRRLHHMGKSGWLMLLWPLPMVGLVLLAWSLVRPGRELSPAS